MVKRCWQILCQKMFYFTSETGENNNNRSKFMFYSTPRLLSNYDPILVPRRQPTTINLSSVITFDIFGVCASKPRFDVRILLVSKFGRIAWLSANFSMSSICLKATTVSRVFMTLICELLKRLRFCCWSGSQQIYKQLALWWWQRIVISTEVSEATR